MAGIPKVQRETHNRLKSLRPGASPAELRDSIIALCATSEYDPIGEMMRMATGRNLAIKEKVLGLANELRSLGEDEPFDANEFADRLAALAESIPQLSPSDEIAIHKEIAQYVAPKLKSMDVGGTVSSSINVTIKQFVIGVNGNVNIDAKKTDVPINITAETPVNVKPSLGSLEVSDA